MKAQIFKHRLNQIGMTFTYSSLLLGFPTREINEYIISSYSYKPCFSGLKKNPYLFPPIVKPFTEKERIAAKAAFWEKLGKKRIYERLPAVVCKGEFQTDCGAFSIVWFQETFEWPNLEIIANLEKADLTDYIEEINW